MYTKIINPKTGRKVSVTSRLGKQILKKYVSFLTGGGDKSFENLFSTMKGRPSGDARHYKKINEKQRLKQLRLKQRRLKQHRLEQLRREQIARQKLLKSHSMHPPAPLTAMGIMMSAADPSTDESQTRITALVTGAAAPKSQSKNKSRFRSVTNSITPSLDESQTRITALVTGAAAPKSQSKNKSRFRPVTDESQTRITALAPSAGASTSRFRPVINPSTPRSAADPSTDNLYTTLYKQSFQNYADLINRMEQFVKEYCPDSIDTFREKFPVPQEEE